MKFLQEALAILEQLVSEKLSDTQNITRREFTVDQPVSDWITLSLKVKTFDFISEEKSEAQVIISFDGDGIFNIPDRTSPQTIAQLGQVFLEHAVEIREMMDTLIREEK